MKKMRFIFNRIFFGICGLLLLTTVSAGAQEKEENAAPQTPYFAENYDYYIQNCDVFLTVDANRNVNVQQIITVRFNNSDTKLIRQFIPKFHGQISDVRVSVPHHESDGLSHLKLEITADPIQTPTLQYEVSYNHHFFSNDNSFDFQIVPPEWKVPVQRVRFKLQLPDYVKNKDVHLFINRKEITDAAEGAEYLIKEDRIIGRTTLHGLKPKQTFRIRVDVPENFFIHNGKDYASYVWVGLLLLTILSFLLWYVYAQDDHVPAIISQNPPRGINAAEAELIHGGKLTEKSLPAMIIALANKGYLMINTVGKNFTLIKIKNYTGHNCFVKQIIQALFADKDIAESSELKADGRFYQKWYELRELSEQPEVLQRFHKKSPEQYLRRAVMLGCLIGNMLLTLFVLRNYLFSEEYLLIAALIMVSGFVGIKLLSQRLGLVAKVLGGIFLLYVLWLMWFGHSTEIQKADILQILIGFGCTIISLICFLQMPQPNAVGRLYRGQLFGLKNFIKFVDKERLEKITSDNPSYFYKILPYAYVLGLHNEWLKLFDDIEIPTPAWTDNNNFKIKNFMRNFPVGISATLAASSLADNSEK